MAASCVHSYSHFMSLCPRCGAILQDRHRLDVARRGECQACGLGYSSTPLLAVAGPTPTVGERGVDNDQAQLFMVKLTADRRHALAHCPFPIYGLDDSWTGRRWV